MQTSTQKHHIANRFELLKHFTLVLALIVLALVVSTVFVRLAH
jgi:uncharacterized protein (UPF0333 family)